MDKEEYAERFGRWIKSNEIVLEDLTESQLLDLGRRLAEEGYCLEYWKAPKQESGHLHIKNIKFDRCPEKLTTEQLNEYKKLFMKKYVLEELWDSIDWSFVETKRHRIAEENKEHYKGYGVKQLIKNFGEGNENKVEKNLYYQAMKIKQLEIREINPNASKIQQKVLLTDIARAYGLNLRNNKCVCPFHADKDPSLIFSDEKGCFYCFGCHVKGGIIKFVQMMEDLNDDK